MASGVGRGVSHSGLVGVLPWCVTHIHCTEQATSRPNTSAYTTAVITAMKYNAIPMNGHDLSHMTSSLSSCKHRDHTRLQWAALEVLEPIPSQP